MVDASDLSAVLRGALPKLDDSHDGFLIFQLRLAQPRIMKLGLLESALLGENVAFVINAEQR